jgi:hypothetical protein
MKPSAEIIRAKLDTGLLPVDHPATLRIGDGSGEACAVCEQPVLTAQSQYEAQYHDRPTIRFHARCHFWWRAELRGRRS